jgi:hypothetical protein
MLSAFYDPASGFEQFQLDDANTGKSLLYHGYSPGAGKVYRQARVGAEFAGSPWGTFTYAPPATETHLVTFRDSFLVTYSGHVSGFSSWWTHHKIIATSDGTSSGTAEVRPHNLYNSGHNFGAFLEP